MLKVRYRMAVAMAVLIGWSAAPAAADDWSGLSFVQSPAHGGGATIELQAEYRRVGNQSATASGSTTEPTCTYLGSEVDCTSEKGAWSQSRQCWVRQLSPQPSFGLAIWEGRTEGAIHRCSPPAAPAPRMAVRSATPYLFWAPDGDAVDLVDPVVLAERAVEQMRLTAPRIGLTPLEPEAPLLVGVDMWLWIENADERGFGPITRTATAGPSSVTARARVTKVVWDMGDGNAVTCMGAGTPWTPSKGTGPSPTCGYRYASPSHGEPGRAFEVRATAHWLVDWSGAGQSGTIRFTLRGSRDVPVTELQVLHVS